MGRLMNYFRGMATVGATGLFPERLVNLCAREGVEFWGLEWLDEYHIRLTVRRRDLKRLRELTERANCSVEVEGSRGLPDFLLRFRRRYAFLIGLAFSLCAVAVLSRFVLTIDVVGNERVSTAAILDQLRLAGVRPGVYGPSIDREQVAQEALLGLEELAWMGINLHGTRLEIIVRENVPPPERVDESGYYHVISKADGIITHLEAELGEAVVQEGDTVTKGETLISGTVTIQPPIYSDLPVRTYQTHARGRIWARTWRTLTAEIPLEASGKTYTGEESDDWFLVVFGRRIEIFRNSSISWPFYDKITSVYQGTLYDNTKLPFYLVRETLRAYEPTACAVNQESAQQLLETALLNRLDDLMGGEGQVMTEQFSARAADGKLSVSLLAECREEIGMEIPGEPEPSAIQSGVESP